MRRLRTAAAVGDGAKLRCARLEGFSLHANVALPAHAREPLEHLCRYLLRPPLALERLTESSGGQLLYELPHPRRDGSTHLLLDPLELIEKLSVLIPPPRFHLLRFHGLLAPRGVVTLCILSSNAWNHEIVSVSVGSRWTKRAPLHLLGGLANGPGVERRRIELPWGTRNHLGRLNNPPLDEPAKHP